MLLARGANMGGFAASGFAEALFSLVVAAKSESLANIDASPTAPKPAPACQRNSRRVRWQKAARLLDMGKSGIRDSGLGGNKRCLHAIHLLRKHFLQR